MGYMTRKERRRIPDYDNPDEISLGEVAFHLDKCTGCGMCVRICPGSALYILEKKAAMKQPPENQCAFCGCCAAICPVDAVIMKKPFRWSGYYKIIEHGEPMPPRL